MGSFVADRLIPVTYYPVSMQKQFEAVRKAMQGPLTWSTSPCDAFPAVPPFSAIQEAGRMNAARMEKVAYERSVHDKTEWNILVRLLTRLYGEPCLASSTAVNSAAA